MRTTKTDQTQIHRLIWVFIRCIYQKVRFLMLRLMLFVNWHITHNEKVQKLIISQRTTKPTIRLVHLAKTQISLGIRPGWSELSLFAWRKLGSLATHWVRSKDSDQTGRVPRLIWVFAGRTYILLVSSCAGSNVFMHCLLEQLIDQTHSSCFKSQTNFSGSNTFRTMDLCSSYLYARSGGKRGVI